MIFVSVSDLRKSETETKRSKRVGRKMQKRLARAGREPSAWQKIEGCAE
jgi:hypothetical protein